MKKVLVLVISLFIFNISILTSPVSAYYTNMPASVVIGQTNFNENSTGITQSKLSGAIRGIFVDPNGRLIVSDFSNNRVLIWNHVPNVNGKNADLVLGQSDFTSNQANRGGSRNASTLSTPAGIWSDGNKLIIADHNNGRVLIWNSFPTQNGQAADVVVGKTSMTDTASSCNSIYGGNPYAVSVYQGKLYYVDRPYNRVLIYNSIPTTDGVAADVVIGQENMTTCSAQTISDKSLSDPRFVQIDSHGRMLVADRGRQRILIWNSPPTTNYAAANVVVGQPDFTTSGSSVTPSGFSGLLGIYSSGSRLFVPDATAQRVTIFNSIPGTNGVPADLVLGQPNFTSSAQNQGISPQAYTIASASEAFEYNNQLLVVDEANARILIYPNTLATPEIQVGGTEPAPEGKVQMNGNVVLGNTNFYSLSRIQASVNGSGYSDVTHFGGGESLGNGQTYYPFYHQFQPWESNGPQESWEDRGYTVKFKTVNSNAEENYQFYMNPLTLNSANSTSIPSLKFTVPKTQWERIKENISGFSALVSPVDSKIKESERIWTNYTGNVQLENSMVDSNTGLVTFTARPQSGLKLTKGKYWIKVVANDKWGHNQQSNVMETTLTDLTGSPYNPLGLPVVGSHIWFPLQVNKITSVNTGGIISTNNLNGIKSTYTSSTTKPVFSGIAYTGATVAMNVTDQKTGKTTTYLTQATDSTWTITPTLTGNSVVNLSVYNQNSWYNELLPLVVNILP